MEQPIVITEPVVSVEFEVFGKVQGKYKDISDFVYSYTGGLENIFSRTK